jgi:hypothetical protein
MYMLPDMIYLGLKDGESFPNDDYKQVACAIGLCNDRINTRSELQEIVRAINLVPLDEIRTVTLIDLATKYKVPYISLS